MTPPRIKLPQGITRNVVVLGVVSLLTDISSEMLYPLIPLFLTSALGASPAIIGVIEGLAESTASLLKIWSGRWSDQLGARKPLVFAGYGLSALTRPLLATAYSWPTVLLARLIDRFGKGIRGAPRDALIADSVEAQYRGRAFGFHRSMDQTGAIIGPLLGAGLLHYYGGDFRLVFLTAFLPSLLSTLAIGFAREQPAESLRPHVALRFQTVSPEFRRFLLLVGLFSLGNSADAFLILRARHLGSTTENTLLLFALFNTVYVLSAYPAGALSDRFGRVRVFGIGLAAFALVYAGFGLATDAIALPWLFAVYGLYMGLTDGVSRAVVVDFAPEAQRGTALGLHAAVVGIMALPASVFAGWLWTKAGPQWPFLFGAATAASAGTMLLLFGSKTKRASAV
ncbi:MAG: MFS transporter [Bryobacteraceae bacterium]|nr:MFS transporter [Bryobacteraceae bacterium]